MSDVIAAERGTCRLIHSALSKEECAAWIRRTEALGYGATGSLYPASYRNNDRLVFDDVDLANDLFARMRGSLPPTVDRFGWRWRLVGLNERFRCCRYRGGQSFSIHRDGAHVRSAHVRSLLTFMVYLNGGGFEGGATRFFDSRDASAEPTLIVRPEQGKLVIFGHDVWHEGEAVTGGTKYVMRSDVLYERVSRLAPTPGDSPATLSGHTGYVWQVIRLADGRLASGSRDGTVRIWKPDGSGYAADQVLDVGLGSVTALLAHPDGTLWGGGRDGTLRLWRARGDRFDEDPAVVRQGAGAVLCLAAIPGGAVAVGGGEGEITIRSQAGVPLVRLRGHQGWVWALSIQDGVLCSGGEDGTVRRWSIAHGASLEAVEIGAPAQVGEPVRALASLPDGRVVVGTASGRVQFLNGDTVGSHDGAVRALLPLGDGGLASAGEDDRVLLWDRAFTPVRAFVHEDFVTSLCRLPGNRLASSSYDGTIRFWESGHRIE